jgi:hypothetical protein
MAIDNSSLTPQQRLAVSRRALFNQIESKVEREARPSRFSSTRVETPVDGTAPLVSPRKKRGLFDSLPWLQLAQPLLQRYARKQPGKLIAIAAGTGAVIMLVKPWRLLSVTALVAAVLKTSDVADMVTTLMHSQLADQDTDRT